MRNYGKGKSVPSPTGRPSPKSSGVKKMEAGDYSGGSRPGSMKSAAQLEKERKARALKRAGGTGDVYRRKIEEALLRAQGR